MRSFDIYITSIFLLNQAYLRLPKECGFGVEKVAAVRINLELGVEVWLVARIINFINIGEMKE